MAQNQPRGQQPPLSQQVAKTTTAVAIGGTLMVLSGLTLALTVIGVVAATPVLLIFSPVLVPATVSVFLLIAGFLASGGFAATATYVLYWMYKYATGKHPMGADQLDRARGRITGAAKDVKDRAEQFGHEQLRGGQGS